MHDHRTPRPDVPRATRRSITRPSTSRPTALPASAIRTATMRALAAGATSTAPAVGTHRSDARGRVLPRSARAISAPTTRPTPRQWSATIRPI